MNILITAPSLDIKKNVSGISAVTNTIINNNPQITYEHFLLGKADDALAGIFRIIPLIKNYNDWVKILKQNRHDLIHLNLALNPKALLRDFLAYKIAWLFKKTTVTHLHGGKYLLKNDNWLYSMLINNVLKTSSKIMVLSDYEKELVLKNYDCGKTPVYVLPNTVEKQYINANVQETDNTLKFLFLGRLHESKGLQYVIDAFNQYISLGYSGILNICGTGPLKQYIIDNANMNKNIIYHDILSGANKLSQISQNNIFLLPSIHGEGLPVALLETMAVGLVPIVTTDGSMGKIVSDMQNGMIVSKANTQELVEKMCLMAKDRTLLNTLSKNSKNYIKDNYDIDKYIDTLNAIYKASV